MSNKLWVYIGCLMFATQSAFAFFVQQQQLQSIATNLSDDVELICTGSDMKFISMSLTEARGHFVFVEAPTDVSSTQLANACPNLVMSESSFDIVPITHNIASAFARHQALVASLAQRPYTSYQYQTALSRAPPVA